MIVRRFGHSGKAGAVIIQTFVPGLPVPQARARARVFARKGTGKLGVSMYDPETSRDWKRTVLHYVAIAHRGRRPHVGPIGVELWFYLPRPKSLKRSVVHHVKRPDVDNLAKAVKDAMRGVVYVDDSQVVRLMVDKQYTGAGEERPGVHITVTDRGGT